MTQYLRQHHKRPMAFALALVMVLTLFISAFPITASAAETDFFSVDPLGTDLVIDLAEDGSPIEAYAP